MGTRRLIFALFMVFSIVNSAFAQDSTPVTPPPGRLTIYTVDENGSAIGGACFDITTADGAVSSFCDSGLGTLELANLVPGDVVVAQTSEVTGYSFAEPTFG